jgi:hypothetical protein
MSRVVRSRAALMASALGGLTVVLATAFGCSGASGAAASSRLASLVVSDPPPGYVPGPAAASGAFGLQSLAQTSPLPTAVARAHLEAAGIAGGAGRTFTRGSAYAVVVLMHARDAAHASELATVETDATTLMSGTAAWAPTVVPDAHGYLFNGTRHGHVEFCQGAWVTKDADVFHVYTCDSGPASVAVLETLMRQQYELLRGGSLPTS